MDIIKLEKYLAKKKQPRFRIEQLKKAIYQDGISSFLEISTLPKELRESLESEERILSLDSINVLESSDNKSAKALFKTGDDQLIETVLMSPKPGAWSVCVSSQIGCPMGCGFCATGKMGFQRNLSSEEITDQVLFWRQYMQKNTRFLTANSKLTNVVYMGMGEPFLNWEEVKKSIKDLINPELFGFGSRSISVSTSGVAEGIEKLADDFPQVNLAISLHFAEDIKRSQWMPVNRKDNLEKLRIALKNYFRKTNRQVFVEYILLDGVNDSWEEANKLIAYLKSIGKNHLLHVNLIRYNNPNDQSEQETGNTKPMRASELDVAREFRHYLERNGISVTIRKSLGSDIQGACGQLAGKK